MNQRFEYHEQLTIAAAQLRPGDTVLLTDGDRTVSEISSVLLDHTGQRKIMIRWTTGHVSSWLADGSVDVIR